MTKINAAGMRELQRDLAKISKDAGKDATKAIKAAAEPIRVGAARRAPRSSGVPKGRKHLADSLKVSVTRGRVRIVSPLAHAKIVHDGGRHPLFGNRQVWIPVPPRPFIHQVALADADRMLEDLADATEALILRNGFDR